MSTGVSPAAEPPLPVPPRPDTPLACTNPKHLHTKSTTLKGTIYHIHLVSVLGTPAKLDPSGPRYRGSDEWTNIGLKASVPQEDSVLHGQSTYTSHPRAGGALGPHRGEDISIEAFDGHWPASIGRVWGTRPGRSPRTSGRSPRGSLLPPLLLAFFLLPDPHELHSPSLPADDHCRGMGTGDSSSYSSSLLPLRGL